MRRNNERLNKIKYDNSFIPTPIEKGEEYFENGIFVFNISKMIAAINANPQEYEKQKISVNAYRQTKDNWNESYVNAAELSKPVILGEIRPGTYNVLDGHHRLEKAYRKGIAELEAYFLRPEQHIPFLTTQEGYAAYVQYWNMKIDDDNGIR